MDRSPWLSVRRRSERRRLFAEGGEDYGIGHQFQDQARRFSAERQFAEPVREGVDRAVPSPRIEKSLDLVRRRGGHETLEEAVEQIEAARILVGLALTGP